MTRGEKNSTVVFMLAQLLFFLLLLLLELFAVIGLVKIRCLDGVRGEQQRQKLGETSTLPLWAFELSETHAQTH